MFVLCLSRMLKKLAAQQMIKLEGIYKLQNRYVPTHLYPLLFAEAARLDYNYLILLSAPLKLLFKIW